MIESLIKIALGIALTSVFAWLCFKSLSLAKISGKFGLLIEGISEKDSSYLFQLCKVMITGLAYFFACVSVVLVIAFAGTLLGLFE